MRVRALDLAVSFFLASLPTLYVSATIAQTIIWDDTRQQLMLLILATPDMVVARSVPSFELQSARLIF
jgi:hypothetical protein